MEEPTQTPQPSYVHQIITIMAATEGHPDPAVRAARKTVANALVALKKAHDTSGLVGVPTASPRPRPQPQAPAPNWTVVAGRPGKGAGSTAARQRIAALGTTSRAIREWARSRGHDVPDRGQLPTPVIDAYADAHQAAAS